MTPLQHVDTSIDKHLMVSNDLNLSCGPDITLGLDKDLVTVV
jgi:hypothetical protein